MGSVLLGLFGLLVQEGRAALERVNQEMGLAFDERDLDVSTDYTTPSLTFVNPTRARKIDGKLLLKEPGFRTHGIEML